MATKFADLSVAAPVETVGQPQDATELANQSPVFAGKAGKVAVGFFGFGFAVVARQIGDDFPLARGEPEQVGVADQVVLVFVVLVVADEVTDIVQ